MEINAAVWGAASSWETYNISPVNIELFGGKLPVFDSSQSSGNINRYSVASALSAGRLSTDKLIDATVCPWRIKGDSYFLGDLHRVALLTGTPPVFKAEPLYDEYARNMGAPLALTWGNAPSNGYNPEMLNPKYHWNEDFNPSSPQYSGAWSPLVDFDYKKICVIPVVVAYDSVEYQVAKVSLKYYLDHGGNTRYRYLQGIIPRFYVGGAGHWTGVGAFRLRPFGAMVKGFEVDNFPNFAEDFATYGNGVEEVVIGSTQSNGFTDYSASDKQSTEKESYRYQLTNHQCIFYRSIPDGWYLTDRDGSGFITEYDNVNNDFDADWIISQMLTLGLWVYTGDIENFDPDNPDEYAYAPLFDEYGTTTGEGVNGADAALTPAGSWSTDVFSENVYKGEEPPFDPTQYDADNKTVLPSAVFTSGNSMYAITVGELQGVIGVVNSFAENASTQLEVVQKCLTNNPIDVIKGVVFYPFNVKDYIETELTQSEIILGNINSGVDGYKIEQRAFVVDAGSVTYYPPNGLADFRSYEPYSSAELYIPYCGSVKIAPSDYIGHKVGVKYLIDIESGGCVALVYRDGLAIDSIAGQIGVSCPITGVQTATLQAAQEQANRSSVNSKIAMGAAAVGVGAAIFTAGSSLALTAAAVGGAATLTAAGSKLDASQYQLEHMQIPYKSVGAASAATSTVNEQCCRLVIHRPVLLEGADLAAFGEVNGFACCITAALSNFSGFTQVSNAELDGVSCTAAERAALMSALQAGVYL